MNSHLDLVNQEDYTVVINGTWGVNNASEEGIIRMKHGTGSSVG